MRNKPGTWLFQLLTKGPMKSQRMVRNLLLSAALCAGSATFAQVSFSIIVAPPPVEHEVVPMMPQGYVWAPGYWAWNLDHHIWVRGRPIVQRTGYRWEPDRWEQRDGNYARQPGRWEPDGDIKTVKFQKIKKPKHNQGQANQGESGNSNQNRNPKGH